MFLSKECWVGGNLTFFRPSWLSTKKVCLTSSEAKRVLLWFVLYFSGLRRLNCTKKHPLESSLEFLDSLKYENIIEHVVVWACKIHESVLYQEFFCPFFYLSKNEEGPEFSFLDSLNLYKKEGKGSSFTCILHLLRPRNSQETTVRDSPQSTLPTRPLTVWYRESVRFAVRLP